ncbi:DUF29 family protein [Methylobacterium radiodurans]|uniref:DNA helicase DnaB-like N-terminal domain-containing protein n=1 Tax=Methylobacterium radiodurans TaxID=2202828 RepID=A0A2U8VLQ5_9HYPH|nr:DUF29 family protein [Methylobacterium radiodurans]AWN34332.1 hypothetical protein DK427_00060 [Methylobacterium radiodurans]
MSLKPSRRVESPPQPPTWGEAFAWERELLGTVLNDPSVYEAVRNLVGAGDFSSGLHERLFEAVPKLMGQDGSIDLNAVRSALGDYAWDAEGGLEFWLAGLLAKRVTGTEAVRRAYDIRARAEHRRARPEPIDVDSVAWCHRQAALLTQLAGRSDPLSQEVDWQNIVEELLYVGRSQVSGVVRKMELVFEHLLKLLADPNAPSRDRWRVEIDAFRTRIAREAKPSMRQLIDLDTTWRKGMSDAAADLAGYAVRLPRDLPDTCPFTFEDLTTETLTLAALLEKLAATSDINATQRD